MSFFNRIKLLWNKFKVDLFPTKLYSKQIEEYLKKQKCFKGCYIECTDNVYYTGDRNAVKTIAKLIPSRLNKYQSSVFDCEDFAWEFKYIMKRMFPKFPIGYVHVKTPSGKRAMNLVVYTFKGKPRYALVEPQLGTMAIFTNYDSYLCII